uniref:RNase Bm2 n=1 Tax=Bryopsis maxima TaxID=3129 RepID=Q4LF17_BRYMA|nr:RNase Bm2 [Bryopsis maxima]BAE06158.1 RNase Bm2 [Bryopsis maxima]
MAVRLGVIAIIVAAILVPSYAVDFDFFYLTRQWAGGVCKHSHKQLDTEENRRTCTRYPDDDIFTIHGLWPNREDGTWPSYCDDSAKFDGDLGKDLLEELSSEWPSYYGSNYGFWKHEWEKHGTCAGPLIADERDYFDKTLELKEKYDLMDALTAAGITPSTEEIYSRQGFEDAIKAATGAKPVLLCSGKNPATLTEIWMCFSKDLKPINCTAGTSSRCRDLRFLPISRTHSTTYS